MEKQNMTIVEDKVLKALSLHKKSIFLVFMLIAVSFLAWTGYSFRQSYLNKKASKAFHELLRLTEEAKSEEKFDELYKQAKACPFFPGKLTPFVLAKKASFLISKEKYNEALPVLTEAVTLMAESPLKDLYKIKRSKLQIMLGGDLQQEGIKELEIMAVTGHEAAKKLALFTLHEHFWNLTDFENSAKYGRQLLQKSVTNAVSETAFSNLEQQVQFNLSLISID